ETGNTENLSQSGWPPALNNNKKDKLSLNYNLVTAKQTLCDTGIHFRVAEKSLLCQKSMHNWCKKHKNKTAHNWMQVIFSDK
ncbi:9873_t:CDS:2, partial [Diversispora eburnea]